MLQLRTSSGALVGNVIQMGSIIDPVCEINMKKYESDNTASHEGDIRGQTRGTIEKIATKDKQGRPRVKNVSKEELERISVWMRKSWSTRARRWLK